MKTTFVFDTVIYKINNSYYTRTLTYDLWKERYFQFFGYINLVTRVEEKNEKFLIDNPMLQIINGEGVEVNPINEYRKFPDAISRRQSIIEKLEEELKKSDFAILRAPAMLSNFSEKICRKNGIPYLIELVADPWNVYYYHSNIAGKIIAPYMHFRAKKMCEKSQSILYVTERYLQNRYPALTKKQTGLSDVIIRKSDKHILSDRKAKIETISLEEKFKFGIVGNYDLKIKGQNLAIKALADLSDNCILELVGGGNKKKLEDLVKQLGLEDRVVFLGTKKAGDEMFNWMDDLDVLLMPSFTEGLPRVMVEGMSRALPAIGSNVGGIIELIDSSLIFEKGKLKELQHLMKGIVNNKKLLLNQAEKNFTKSQDYLKVKLDDKRGDFYTSILKGIGTDE